MAANLSSASLSFVFKMPLGWDIQLDLSPLLLFSSYTVDESCKETCILKTNVPAEMEETAQMN